MASCHDTVHEPLQLSSCLADSGLLGWCSYTCPAVLCCCAVLLCYAAWSTLDTAGALVGKLQRVALQWGYEYRLPYRQASTFKGLVLFYRTTTNFTVRHIGLGVYYFVLYSARRPARADVCAFL